MKAAGLKTETEALITAAQARVLNTKAHQAKILKISTGSKCRQCKLVEETVKHILTGCPQIAETEYLRRPNSVAGIIHKNICDICNIDTTKQA